MICARFSEFCSTAASQLFVNNNDTNAQQQDKFIMQDSTDHSDMIGVIFMPLSTTRGGTWEKVFKGHFHDQTECCNRPVMHFNGVVSSDFFIPQ